MASRTEFDRNALSLEVWTCPWLSTFYPSGYPWTARTDLVARVELRDGNSPSRCILHSSTDPDGSTDYQEAKEGEIVLARGPSTYGGHLYAPFKIKPWDFIKIRGQSYDTALRTVFLGVVTGWQWNRRACRFELIAQDFRVLMRRIRCLGSVWRRPLKGDTINIPDLLHFNADGKPDQRYVYDSGAYTEGTDFITPDHNRDPVTGLPITGSADLAKFWSPGSSLNCLRDLFVETPVTALVRDCSPWLWWPLVQETDSGGGPTYCPWLFKDPTTSEVHRIMDLECTGKDLAWTTDQLVNGAGPISWTLDYEPPRGVIPTGNPEKAYVRFFKLYPAQEYELQGDLALGVPGQRIDECGPDAHDADFEFDWSEAYQRVRAVGARKRLDVSFSSAEPTLLPLRPLYTTAQASAWLALGENDERKNSQAYRDVLLAFGVYEALDWTTWLGTVWKEGGRRVFQQLATTAIGDTEAASRPVNLSIQVWRYKGGAWEALPGSIGVQLLEDRVGVRLAPTARQTLVRYAGGTAEPWTYDPATGSMYDIRITVSLEGDERLYWVADDSDSALPWPDGELYLPAGNKYQLNVRRKCWLRADTGVPVTNGGSPAEFGPSSDNEIRDDSDELQALAYRKLAMVNRPRMRGTLALTGLRGDLYPGWMAGRLTGANTGYGMDLCQAVRGVDLDAEGQTTTLHFKGI